MKKIFATLLMLVTISVASAQKDPVAIVKNYQKMTGIENMDLDNPNTTTYVKMTVTTSGVTMPIEIILQGDDKFRMIMSAEGQEAMTIKNGNQGWVKIDDYVQALPEDALNQQTSQNDVLSNVRFDTDDYDFEYMGKVKGLDLINATKKDDGVVSKMEYDEDGLMVKITTVLGEDAGASAGEEVEVILSDYKKFGDIYIPSLYTTNMSDQEVAKMKIKEYVLNYPVDATTFAEPK